MNASMKELALYLITVLVAVVGAILLVMSPPSTPLELTAIPPSRALEGSVT